MKSRAGRKKKAKKRKGRSSHCVAHDDPKKILRFYKVVPSLSLGHVRSPGGPGGPGYIERTERRGEEKRREEMRAVASARFTRC
jgi:hypothetical protein